MYSYKRPAVLHDGQWPSTSHDGRQWVLVLNKYQRDNLLALLNWIGYGRTDDEGKWAGGVGPFALANTGDWCGEIGWMLGDPDVEGVDAYDAEKTGRPNRTVAELRRMLGQ